jgi:ABC-type sugar transport system permease subunit/ABC-type glycerol-3-phosphate transport system substrate-binding protein
VRAWALVSLTALLGLLAACRAGPAAGNTITFSGSSVGAEGEVLLRQLRRFEAQSPGLRVELRHTPDAADQRHQLYVQWLNARVPEPDVLQLDVIWTPEFAAAGWLRPLDEGALEVGDFFAPAVEADRWDGRLYALPWFVDVGMLYWRTDLMPHAPRTFDELAEFARRAQRSHGLPYGLVWQGARYEGLVTVFGEFLGGFGGSVLGSHGAVALDEPPAVEALGFMRRCVEEGLVPRAALAWQEEQVRFAFQNGQAALMRNWPYAYGLMQDPASSKVAGRFAVAPMPAQPGGRPTAALGGSQLAVSAYSRRPAEALALVRFLTGPEQMRERAEVAGQFPARRSLYASPLPGLAVPPADALRIVESATPRPVTPVYTELSVSLQVAVHRALTGQAPPATALGEAAREVRSLFERTGLGGEPREAPERRSALPWALAAAAASVAAVALLIGLRKRARLHPATPRGALREAPLAWALMAPALAAVVLVAVFPLAWTAWDSLHLHDLRMPWLGQPFVGLDNYRELFGSGRFWGATARTAAFTAATVACELGLGLVLALSLDRAFRGRAVARAAVLVPWAVPAVVAAVIWRFMFDSQAGLAGPALSALGLGERSFAWFVDPRAAWVPLILADVWKTTPFVALLLLAGLQGIDPALYEAARVDGAGAWQTLRYLTLPLLKPALLVALLFRTLDAFRVFDLVYVLTGGGPGVATEPLSLLTFEALLQDLRFGLGAALSVVVFGVTFVLALAYVRLLGGDLTKGTRE